MSTLQAPRPPTLPSCNCSGKAERGGRRQNQEHRRGLQTDAGKGTCPYLEQQNELWEPLYGLHHQAVERDAVGAGLLALLWGEARLTHASGRQGPPPGSAAVLPPQHRRLGRRPTSWPKAHAPSSLSRQTACRFAAKYSRTWHHTTCVLAPLRSRACCGGLGTELFHRLHSMLYKSPLTAGRAHPFTNAIQPSRN